MSEDEIILTHILQCSRAELLTRQQPLSARQQKEYSECVRRRREGEPLQYILGVGHFYGLDFAVSPGVLIPRPETEGLVQLALKSFRGTDILDLGSGSGNIAVTLAKLLPYVKVTAVEISVEAMAVALANAQAHGVESRVDLINADMRDVLEEMRGPVDLVISNPPYIPTAQIPHLPADVRQEPLWALDGGERGLDFLGDIISKSPRLLRPGGYLMMEFGDGQAGDVRALAGEELLFSRVDIYQDLAGKDRIIICRRGGG